MTVLLGSRRALSRYAGDCSRFNRLALVASASEAYPSQQIRAGERLFATSRKKRVAYEKYDSPQLGTSTPVMSDPFVYSGDSVEEYNEKATLSPWTPVPDSVARRIFDISQVQEDDVREIAVYVFREVCFLLFADFNILVLYTQDSCGVGIWRRTGEFFCSRIWRQAVHWD